jgi:N-methylhydantoinase A
MRFSADTGGTFTDLVVEDDDLTLHIFKSPTTPDDPVRGILTAFDLAARELRMERRELLSRGQYFMHGTTRAINAILTGTTARTAYLTTAGHPDVLLLREGGRQKFNKVQDYPEPYIPRSLTFEIRGRIRSDGKVTVSLDNDTAMAVVDRLRELRIEAVAVCLLWSIVNPAHELRVGEILEEHLPGIPFTLSHRLNPSMREYRRGSSAAIDASLKPLMGAYLGGLEQRMCEAGFDGRLLIVTSNGGVLDAADVAEAPIHAIRSGPAMAPIAGRYFSSLEETAGATVVADAGGTSYDVSLVRWGQIPRTRETWLGSEFEGHMTGFPSIDVRSIGAGGGSIAWVDDGGLLNVGPQSAGADPGPACYGYGGTQPTVTDASLILGYIDPDYFLGGDIRLDVAAAARAIANHIGEPLGLGLDAAASAVMQVVTENMVQLIEEISLNQGVDPRSAVLVGGGGAAGLNSVAIARRLGCPRIIIPEVGPLLSAVGALLSDLTADYEATFVSRSQSFDLSRANDVLAGLRARCQSFIDGPGAGSTESTVEYSVAVRYPSEIWQLEVPLRWDQFTADGEIQIVREDFHALHAEIFGTSDPGAPVMLVGWRGRARCEFGPRSRLTVASEGSRSLDGERSVYFPGLGSITTPVRSFDGLAVGERIIGPVIVESPVTTIVIDPGAIAERVPHGSLVISPSPRNDGRAPNEFV